ncbi:Fic family protein [Breznakia pachnodae]|uniref:Fic family protein n=1 Tax=Breznakia pachnodae TaxID=265178 RepID=A0ABU0DZ58_9FIRM|nr:Fic family protein [Breznakia pachnodae]MDQ0359922.1 Fic family protein [Breznakia pachnodae]
MEHRSGHFKTNLSGESAYQSFVPSPLPPYPDIELTNEIIKLLISSHAQLAVLNDLSCYIPNVNLFISMYVRKEALMSSQIEGTQATLEDVLNPTIEENSNRNVAEVINYIKASEFALERIQTLPFSARLLREIHGILMQGVRGQEKNPAEFRTSQNWIGGQGRTLSNARYVPPTPEDMAVAISDLENFIHEEDGIDSLIKIALIHYQFETIHPFLDGNGRVGRLMINLFLMDKDVLLTPALYISYYLKQNRIEYYDRLTEVRMKGNYEQWVQFFLEAVYESAKDAVTRIHQLNDLHNKNHNLILTLGRSAQSVMEVFNYIEANPIIEIGKTAKAINMSFNSVSSAVKKLIENKILVQENENTRNRTFIYKDYLDILRDGTE